MKEIFDRVKTHLLAQGETANDNTMCVYHSQSGLKCAVGCLITEDAYREAFEGRAVADEPVRRALEASGINTDNNTISMLTNLQSIHDDKAPDEWEDLLARLEAKLFGDTE